MKNVFTIDTEDWYHANYEDNLFENNTVKPSTVEENVDRYLELFNKYDVKATFFVLGYVAEEHGSMVKKIAGEGHEIASHGYAHHLAYKQSPLEFREDVRKSKIILEDLVGKRVIGYRAPSWSITEKSLWALPILEEEKFIYTSSIFPTKNYLYGIPYAPRFIHGSGSYGQEKLKLIHVPPTTKQTGKMLPDIPFSGGAYFRLLPIFLIKHWTRYVNEKESQPVIFYLHPREIDRNQPRLKLKIKDAFIHYYGIKNCEKKVEQVLSLYKFDTIKGILGFDE